MTRSPAAALRGASDTQDLHKGARLGVPFSHDEDEDRDEPPADEQDEDEDQGDEPDDSSTGDDRNSSSGRARRGGVERVGQAATVGAGWLLGALLWGWVVLPLIQGGPDRVKKTLMAKFLNKGPDGTELP